MHRFVLCAVAACIALTSTAAKSSAQVLAPSWSEIRRSLVVIGYKKGDGTFAAYGTGFCIKSSASSSQFLTDAHVIAVPTSSEPLSLVAILSDSRTVPATIVQSSTQMDLAIVSVAVGNIPALTISASPPEETQTIAVGGYPYIVGVRFGGLFGSGEMLAGQQAHLAPDVHMGAVSSLQSSWIVFDINGGTVDHGNSGGPLFDPKSGVVYGVLEGFVPGSVDSNAQGPQVATAYSNLAMAPQVVAAFMKGESGATAAVSGVQRTSAVNDPTAAFRALADRGNVVAQNTLGLMYRDGKNGVQRDDVQAVHYFQLAANAGNADGQVNLGAMYVLARGVPQDYATALHWFQLAAVQNNSYGQYSVGYLYYFGFAVPKDYATALHWFELAAAQGNHNAEYSIGYMYDNGIGVPKDDAMAARWYKLAAAAGVVGAENNLGLMYYSGRGGLPQDTAIALKYFREAAAGGGPGAQNNLGLLYFRGTGVPQDYAAAMHWYQLSAAQGFAAAQLNVGTMYYGGFGVAKDYAMALHWFLLSANQGNPMGERAVGFVYQQGAGVAQDYATAMRWYQRAADAGLPIAYQNIGVLYENGWGVPQDFATALHWYQLGAAQNEPRSQYRIGSMYENGHGVPRDYTIALHWYQLAAAQGDADAQAGVQRIRQLQSAH